MWKKQLLNIKVPWWSISKGSAHASLLLQRDILAHLGHGVVHRLDFSRFSEQVCWDGVYSSLINEYQKLMGGPLLHHVLGERRGVVSVG